MSNLYVPPCPDTCGSLADVSFNDCAPELHWGEISKIYLAETTFAGFLDVSALGEWTANLGDTGANKIRTLIVLGDLPEPEQNKIPISGDRFAVGYKTFNLAFQIEETNDINYNWLLMNDCNGKFLMWFETRDGMLYGGNDGLEVTISANQIIPRLKTEIVVINGVATWESLQNPFRCASPMA